MIRNYKAIIFDWDGTLVDTCGLVLDAHNHVRKQYDLPLWTMDDFLGRASESAREYYPKVYGDKAAEAQKILYDYVEKHHLTYLKPMPQAQDLLDIIKSYEIPMGVVSNKRDPTLKIEVAAVGWDSYFSCLVGAGRAASDKPAADPLLLGLKEISSGLTPSDILYIGDTETDLLCARNAACPVALIQSETPRPDLIEKYQPDVVCDSLSALILLLQGAEKANKAC